MGLRILPLYKVVSYNIHVESVRKSVAVEQTHASCRRQQGVGSLQTIMTVGKLEWSGHQEAGSGVA